MALPDLLTLREARAGDRRPKVPVVGVGGARGNVLAAGDREPRAIPSGPSMAACDKTRMGG